MFKVLKMCQEGKKRKTFMQILCIIHIFKLHTQRLKVKVKIKVKKARFRKCRNQRKSKS